MCETLISIFRKMKLKNCIPSLAKVKVDIVVSSDTIANVVTTTILFCCNKNWNKGANKQ